ncbi:MAG: MMPL family transporter [Clostridiales bacterium]|nr:MMPL family transporter [Clostridiales bacterium]
MLSKFSIKRPFTVLVAVIAILVFGVIAYIKMTPDLFPNINTPYVVVMTTYPGASPEEAEIEITEPLEQQFATLANIKNVTSVSAANYSVVSLEFSDDVNMDSISVDIRDKIDQIEGNLPEMSGTPVVMKINLNMLPIVTAAVGMEDKSSGQVSQFTKKNLQSPLEGTEGVASVSAMGMVDDSVQIVLSQSKIDEINKKVSDAIAKQFGSGEGQINGGISAANDGKKQIESGKKAISAGQSQAAAQLETAKAQLEKTRKDLVDLKNNGTVLSNLLLDYNAAVSSGDNNLQAFYLKKMNNRGIADVVELEQMVGQLKTVDDKIAAIDQSIRSIDSQMASLSFSLGSQYADLAAAESTIAATVNQLQSALADVQSSEKAALESADMTGVLTMDNVSAILNAQNFSMPAGYVTDGEAEILVSVGDKIKNKDELNNLVLFDMGIEDVDPIRLSDIGTVSYTDETSDTYAKINGENGVLLSFTKQSSYATAIVADNIQDKFAELERKYKELKFTTLSDQGEYIHIVINSVLQNLFLGAILAILILLFFLRDLRPTLITALSIPISLVFAVVLMYFSGVSLNMVSLAGLAVGVGMLVDNSIVVIENIYRLRSMGYSRTQAAVSGAVQVTGAITASTLTTICVFVPIVFVDGMTKDIFVDLALTVTYSLLASLVIALTLVPAMAKGLLVKDTKTSVLSQGSKPITKYKEIVGWGLKHKTLVIVLAVFLLFASSGLALMRGFSFMPSMSTPQVSATIQMPDESTLEETSKATDEIAKEVKKVDGVETVGAMLASDTLGMMGMSAAQQDVTSTMLYIVLEEDKAENGKIIANKLEKLAKKYDCKIVTSADMDMTSMLGGSGVAINLYGEDLDKLRTTGAAVERQLNSMKELEEVSDINEESTKELKVVVNKNEAMKEGLTVAQVYQEIASKLTKEKTATTLVQSGSDIDVVIESSAASGFTESDLRNMKLTVEEQDGTKSQVSLTSIAEIKIDASLDSINHDNQKRSLLVTAAVKDDYNVTLVTDKVQDTISSKNIVPKGVTIDYGGENEEIMNAMSQMMLMLLVGFILVYLVMVAQFQSLRSPFIVIFTIPLAFTGGMLALLIFGKDVSVVSMMGFVMLMGIVVNNAIVLVDCINRFRLEGMGMDEAIISAGAVRMRPVIMTAVTTVLGLLPLAIGIGTGAEMMQPVALVCIGGLIYATLMTLIIIPIMYKIFAKKHMEKIKEEELEIVTV